MGHSKSDTTEWLNYCVMNLRWEIWVISEIWLDYSKLTCHISSNTNNVSKNCFTTFKRLQGCPFKGCWRKDIKLFTYWTIWAEILIYDAHIDMFEHKFLMVSWDHFLALTVILTGPTEIKKVKKLYRHHIHGTFSSHLNLNWILATGFSFGPKFWKIGQISGQNQNRLA